MSKNRLQFRVWDKERKLMLYNNFVIRSGNPDSREVWDKIGSGEYPYSSGFGGTKGAEPLEYPNTIEINEKITELMGDYAGTWSLIDWSNWYGLENYIVMQSTGFADKTGHIIFEGDILTDGVIESEVYWHYGCYVWNGCMIADYDVGFQGDKLGMDTKELKVIGNKYEYNNKDQISLF